MARALKVGSWQLMIEGAAELRELGTDNLIAFFSQASVEGRRVIFQIAEREATYARK